MDAARANAEIAGGLILPFKGVWPAIGQDVFIAPNATVIGNVTIGDGASIWFNVVLRGDDHTISVGARTNIQDGTIVHISKDTAPTVIGSDITIGHGAIVHGCTLQDRCIVGIGAIVLDGAVVESGAVIAAGAVVSPGKRVPSGEVWAGCPARKARDVRASDLDYIGYSVKTYCDLRDEFLRMRRAGVAGM